MVERKGPRADAPEQARDGFLRRLTGLDYTLEQREDKKARVVFALVREPGRAVSELLAELLPAVIARLPMAEVDALGRWRVPLGSAAAVDPVPARRPGGGRSRSPASPSWRPRPAATASWRPSRSRSATSPTTWSSCARPRSSWTVRSAGRSSRAAPTSWRQAQGLAVADDPALLDEIKGLVEWPVPLLAAIDEAFMTVPPEVLVTTMRSNQKYLALRTPDGALARQFVLVANIEAQRRRGGDRRRQRARAACPAVGRQVLLGPGPQGLAGEPPAEAGPHGVPRRARHAGPAGRAAGGADRRARAAASPGADRMLAERAALLAKADLVTGMVGEFPELQGIMGGHYAAAQGEPPAVATPSASTTRPRGRTTAARPRRKAWRWPWPTSSTPSSASSPPASARPAPRTRSRCAAPASASSG